MTGLVEYINADELKRDIDFSLTELDDAVRTHTSLFIHYANLARLARQQFDKTKLIAEVTKARLYMKHRDAMLADGGKATEAMIDAAVTKDPDYISAQKTLIEARGIYELGIDARDAFSQRKDLLVQVSVDRRREREGDLRIYGPKSDEVWRDTQRRTMEAY